MFNANMVMDNIITHQTSRYPLTFLDFACLSGSYSSVTYYSYNRTLNETDY